MNRALGRFWNRLLPRLDPADEAGIKQQASPDWFDEVEQARRELLAARAYFENVTDPALVDHAIAVLDAAEKKYVYLLRRARGRRVDGPSAPTWSAPNATSCRGADARPSMAVVGRPDHRNAPSA